MEYKYPDIDAVLERKDKDPDGVIKELEEMLDYTRQEQRAETESGMVSDNELGPRMAYLERSLSVLGRDPEMIEDTKAATL